MGWANGALEHVMWGKIDVLVVWFVCFGIGMGIWPFELGRVKF